MLTSELIVSEKLIFKFIKSGRYTGKLYWNVSEKYWQQKDFFYRNAHLNCRNSLVSEVSKGRGTLSESLNCRPRATS